MADCVCIGSVLWDIIGRAPRRMALGNDVPGRIIRQPGGVAMNIARTLKGLGLTPALLTAIGTDAEGEALLAACAAIGLDTAHVLRDPSLPTDSYMAIEGAGGLVAAIADAHSLEAAGARILAPLIDGPLGSVRAPYTGSIALDGNLTEALLSEIAAHPAFAAADLRVAPASPGKATRLTPLLARPNAVLYVNLEEAGLLLGAPVPSAEAAAQALCGRGAARVLVTDGGGAAADAGPHGCSVARPPSVTVRRVTGAGDTFMAAHLVAERRGAGPAEALTAAVSAAARFVSAPEL
ncbi:MAG: PfkB family carbohydrate kinase [Pseudomonadota bacterium]